MPASKILTPPHPCENPLVIPAQLWPLSESVADQHHLNPTLGPNSADMVATLFSGSGNAPPSGSAGGRRSLRVPIASRRVTAAVPPESQTFLCAAVVFLPEPLSVKTTLRLQRGKQIPELREGGGNPLRGVITIRIQAPSSGMKTGVIARVLFPSVTVREGEGAHFPQFQSWVHMSPVSVEDAHFLSFS